MRAKHAQPIGDRSFAPAPALFLVPEARTRSPPLLERSHLEEYRSERGSPPRSASSLILMSATPLGLPATIHAVHLVVASMASASAFLPLLKNPAIPPRVAGTRDFFLFSTPAPPPFLRSRSLASAARRLSGASASATSGEEEEEEAARPGRRRLAVGGAKEWTARRGPRPRPLLPPPPPPPPPSAQIRRAAARPSPPALRRRHPGPCRRAVAGRDVPRGGGGGGMGSRYRITERKTARWGVGCGKVPRGNLRISLVCRGGTHVSAMRNAVMYAHIYI